MYTIKRHKTTDHQDQRTWCGSAKGSYLRNGKKNNFTTYESAPKLPVGQRLHLIMIKGQRAHHTGSNLHYLWIGNEAG